MCEFTDWSHKNEALRNFGENSAEEVVSFHMSLKFPYALQPRYCPACGKYLENFERRPLGRTTRSMCVNDYDALIANRINYNCFVCNMPLPEHKVRAQMGNQRQITEHMHEGACIQRWTVIHNVAVGEPDFVTTFRKQPDPSYAYLNPDRNYVFENDDLAEGNMFPTILTDVDDKLSFQHLQYVSFEEQLPSESFNLNSKTSEFLYNIQDPIARLTTYKGKRVKIIPKCRS